MFVAVRKGIDKIYVARHPSVGVRRQLPSLWAAALEASPVRGYGAERRLRRRKLFLMRQTAVTPFIIACSAIESIGPPFAHRSGLYRFAVMQRSQSTSVLQHAPCDAGTANRTVDAPSGADGGVRCLAAPLPLRVGRGCIAALAGDDACIVPRFFCGRMIFRCLCLTADCRAGDLARRWAVRQAGFRLPAAHLPCNAGRTVMPAAPAYRLPRR